MKLIVESATVYKNVKLFKKIIEKHLHDNSVQFNAYVNRKTGELIFEEEMGACDELNLKQYKPLCLSFSPTTPGFDIQEDMSNDALFDCADLSPHARHMLALLIITLNHAVGQTLNPTRSKEVLKTLIQAELEAPMPAHLTIDLVNEAWHDATRTEAEALLEHKAVGTYLFRKDEYACLLEEQLSSRWRQPIKCLTLTYLAPHDTVRDLTLVSRNNHWYIYDDDPWLEETAYSDIPTLLKDLHTIAEPLRFS